MITFRFKKTVIAIAASTLLLSACATNGEGGWGTKQTVGTGIGALIGGVIGSQVGSGSGRVAAGVIGALIGGALGNWIGSNLDERDQQALAQKSQEALDSGRSMEWKSNHSGASATIRPGAERTVSKNTSIKRSPSVVKVDTLTNLNRPYSAQNSVNLRAGPGTEYDVVGGFKRGQSFTALGRTDNNWIAVGRQGVVVGYVHAPLVREIRSNAERQKVANQGVDLDKITVAQAKDQGFDLDAIEPKAAKTDRVSVQSTCRQVEYNIKTQAGQESRQVEACQGSDGAWQLG